MALDWIDLNSFTVSLHSPSAVQGTQWTQDAMMMFLLHQNDVGDVIWT